jgi:hypothetical protein
LGHLAHQCPFPKKRKHKNNKKEDSDDEKEKNPTNKFKSKKKSFNRYKKGGKAYVGQWITDDEESSDESSSSDSGNEGVAGLPIGASIPPPPSSISTSTHTFASWPKEVTRYMIVMIVIAMMMTHLLMMI